MVSGTKKYVIKKYGIHITAKIQKEIAGLNDSNSTGVSCPIKYDPIQREKPAIDIANPRTFTGYISEIKTQITTQIEMAQKKIYPIIRYNRTEGLLILI